MSLLSEPHFVSARYPGLAVADRVLVAYFRRGNRCLLPAEFRAWQPRGLLVAVTRGSQLDLRLIEWAELVAVELRP